MSEPAAAQQDVAATCKACGTAISTEYYQVNGHVACVACRVRALNSAGTDPGGVKPLLAAVLFGLGAGIVGAAIYYAVIALFNLEIGIVSILIGYMVGYAVRRGAGGRGGRRFQVLAVALTYFSIALAYTPVAVQATLDKDKDAPASTKPRSGEVRPTTAAAIATPETPVRVERVSGGRLLLLLGGAMVLVIGLPIIIVFGSLPSGLISAAIMFFGMSQAWKMTGTPQFDIQGPYRVGSAAAQAV